MRLLASLLVVFAAVLIMGFYTNKILEKNTGEMLSSIDRISHSIDNKQWESALKKTTELESEWKQNAKWWPTLLDHQEMDNIEFSLAKFKEYVAHKHFVLAKGQLSELKLMIEHIPEKEAVSLKNIF